LFSNVDGMLLLEDGCNWGLDGVLLVKTQHTSGNIHPLCTSNTGTKLPSAVCSREPSLVIFHRNHPKRIQPVQYRHDICPKLPAAEAGGAFVPICSDCCKHASSRPTRPTLN
jgi:hypothetical protein